MRSISDAEELKITELAEDKTVAEEIRWFERMAFPSPLDQARHLPGFE